MHKSDALLARGLEALGLDAGGRLADALSRYVAEIERWNPLYGLVGAAGDELVVKHVLDSLAPWREIDGLLAECDAAAGGGATGTDNDDGWGGATGTEGRDGPAGAGAKGRVTLTDLGTGAGLPGIPLSLVFPDRTVRLVERMGKRVTFLQSQQAGLGLANVEILESEAERAPGPHDVAVFRAFRPFSEARLFRAVWSRMAPGGAFAAYKGRLAAARAEIEALAAEPAFGEAARAAVIIPIAVPFLDEERCLAVLRKS